ncbi:MULTISPECIES: hypothetical protein [Rhodomicrobium]|uniref:hypothetical protein n=1 Tax=Rhodomicrobium TaxID=1068 RepID=UPI000B4AFC35|nr:MULTISPECIES: hypothetical protein [Rhodomicrobium]
MNRQSSGGQRADLDFAPALRMYLDNIESWRKHYEKLTQAQAASTDPVTSAYEQTVANLQRGGQEVFKRLVEQQIELCRFMGRRWENYLELPDQLARCRSPADFGQTQLAFLNQLASEYAQETGRLLQPMNELVSKFTPNTAMNS